MKRRAAVVYWSGYAAGAGDLMPSESRPPRRRNSGSFKSKVRIRKRKPEPLIWEEFLR
jgi:hypothetical protein